MKYFVKFEFYPAWFPITKDNFYYAMDQAKERLMVTTDQLSIRIYWKTKP
jgi:hypothetical protein